MARMCLEWPTAVTDITVLTDSSSSGKGSKLNFSGNTKPADTDNNTSVAVAGHTIVPSDSAIITI